VISQERCQRIRQGHIVSLVVLHRREARDVTDQPDLTAHVNYLAPEIDLIDGQAE